MKTVYGTRPIKRIRRTQQAIGAIAAAIIDVVNEIAPATVRQTYYQLVTRGAIDKTEAEYKNVVRLLSKLRRMGAIDFSAIADNTRWMRKPRTYRGLEHLLNNTAQLYRRDLWENQNAYVEIWLEKDALSGVLFEITSQYDVPLMVTRGYPSITFLHSAAETIAECGKPAHLYYFGDYDPSGLDIPKKVEAGIREFAPDADVTFTRLAVTTDQIEQYHLPTRPTKKTDSRCKGFIGESVEVDAIAPMTLRAMVDACITQHLDPRALTATQTAEASEREWLIRLAERGLA